MTMYRASSSVLLACLLLAACSVAAPAPRVTLTRLTPDAGPIGTHVTVTGGGFTAQNNVIKFGPATNLHHPDGTPANSIAEASSTDGTTLTFDVPSSLTSGIVCDTANHCIGIAAGRLQSGAYPVSVVTANGASNALVFTVSATAAPIPTTVPSSTPTVKVPTTAPTETSYRVVAKNILDANTQPFVPYGVEIPSLWVANWRSNPGMQQNIQQLESPVLYDDARNLWHANTLALKLASANLFDQSPYDQGLMNILDGVVNRAHQRGMNVILVLQYESTTRQPLPSQDSVAFWNLMSLHYRDAPWVFFDLFNEPRNSPGGGNPSPSLPAQSGLKDDAAWSLWQNGGAGYLGMQTLVDTIRANGADNLIFADGLAAGEDLNGVPTHLLAGGNVVYAVHPYFGAQHRTPAQWDHWFGNVASAGDFPVVADEWGEYQSSTHGECTSDAPTLVPQFLDYLHEKNVGVIGYALYPGILIRGWDYANPTAFDHPPYTCPDTPFPNFDLNAQGAGQLLMNYFAANSR